MVAPFCVQRLLKNKEQPKRTWNTAVREGKRRTLTFLPSPLPKPFSHVETVLEWELFPQFCCSICLVAYPYCQCKARRRKPAGKKGQAGGQRRPLGKMEPEGRGVRANETIMTLVAAAGVALSCPAVPACPVQHRPFPTSLVPKWILNIIPRRTQ